MLDDTQNDSRLPATLLFPDKAFLREKASSTYEMRVWGRLKILTSLPCRKYGVHIPFRSRTSSKEKHLGESSTARSLKESRRQPYNLRSRTPDSVHQKKDSL
ncbi:hypothetical protein TNCV_1197701 [Trichonephila clavipes]|uniref:Uncharacterized protein n=1 Tax=Trichonephila clavipes TaxID=2585209 RepID=A0A8X6S1D3_TRICX|nr:hypothetical protein TNCV_1197701 [Trichonephila clavipes]